MKHRIAYTYPTQTHLHAFSAREQRLIVDTIDRQLVSQPSVPTRNRKRMRPNPLAAWELRIGHIRVYYDIEQEPEPTVYVNAVGVKLGHRVFIGGEEFELS